MPHILDVGTKKSTNQKLAQPIYGYQETGDMYNKIRPRHTKQ